jgi:hypothetical protein
MLPLLHIANIDIISISFVVQQYYSTALLSREAKYKIYRRPGRWDRITMIETDKLNPIKWDE